MPDIINNGNIASPVNLPVSPVAYQNGENFGLFKEFYANRNAENEFYRQNQQIKYQGDVTAALNQQLHNYQRELRQTEFQDLVDSAKAAGINPIFALGRSNPVTASGGSSSGSSSYNQQRGSVNTAAFIASLAQLMTGISNMSGGISSIISHSKNFGFGGK